AAVGGCLGTNRDRSLGSRPDAAGWKSTVALPPGRVQGLPPLKWIALAAGVCGLTEAGAVLCWGPHLFMPGSRGDPHADRVAGVPPLARLWIGPEVALAVTTDGRLLAWKQPTYGEAARPTPIPGADKLGAQVVEASISYGFA